jgi:hypothetical protein
MGGSDDEAQTGLYRYVKRLLIERMICDAHERNLTFDFEGSVLPGIEPFFRGWGGKRVAKYRVTKIPRLWTYMAWSLHGYWTRHRKKRWFAC